MQERQPADQIGRSGFVRRRAGLRSHPRQRRLQAFVGEVRVEQRIGAAEELPHHLAVRGAGATAGPPQCAADPQWCRFARERGEHVLVTPPPIGDEPVIGLRVGRPAHRRDRRAGAVEVDPEGDRDLFAGRCPERRETPRIEVVVDQAVRRQVELFDDAGVSDHHVGAGAPIDAVSGKPLHGRHRATDDGVAFDHLDVEASPGEIAGRDKAVVPGADDDDIRHVRRTGGRRRGSRTGDCPRERSGRAARRRSRATGRAARPGSGPPAWRAARGVREYRRQVG